MFKLAQNIYKPMAAHTPKVTNPFANAKPMPLNINGTGYKPPVKTENSASPIKNDSYFGGLYNDLKNVGAGINNFVKSTVDTGNRAVRGWGRLLDPASSATMGQRAGWLGKGLTSVGEDFVPGMGQGIINLPANTVKGAADIGTSIVNSVSGGYFDKAKKNVDNFTSKITDPFKVNFAGNRTGVQLEAFNVGQTAGEIAATAGAGAVANGAKNLAARALNYTLPKVPKSISSAYAKGITKLTGDKYPITGPERSVYKQMKDSEINIMRGESPILHHNHSYFDYSGRIPSGAVFNNRTFLNRAESTKGVRLDRSPHMNINTGSPVKDKQNFDSIINTWDKYDNRFGIGKNDGGGTMFIDKISRNFDNELKSREMGDMSDQPSNKVLREWALKDKASPVLVSGHEYGHYLNQSIDDKFNANAGRRLKPEERTPAQQKAILDQEAGANKQSLDALNKETRWWHPTGWLRERRFASFMEDRFGPLKSSNPLSGHDNKDVFGNILPNYAKTGTFNAFRTVPMSNYGRRKDVPPYSPFSTFSNF